MRGGLVLAVGVLVWAVASGAAVAAEVIGARPYELDWAGRVDDSQPALVDFEDLAGWTVVTRDAEASFTRSREQQIWGEGVGKLVYRATGPVPEVRVVPPEPLPIAAAFDAVHGWVYGNTWGYSRQPSTPEVTINLCFLDAADEEFQVMLVRVNWVEWHLCQRRLTPEQLARVAAGGVRFAGFSVTGGRNRDDRTIYLDSLCVFTEAFPTLSFEPRPARGIDMFPGQSSGTNTGPGRLPFPTRPETILPETLVADYRVDLSASADGAYRFRYRGSDGTLVYRVEPRTGTLDDIVAATWEGWPGGAFRPCVGGGVWLAGADGKPVAPERAESLGTVREGDAVVSRWRLSAGAAGAEVAFTYRLWGKSLVVDVVAPGGQVAEVRYGRALGLPEPRLVTTPYYPALGGRPGDDAAVPDRQHGLVSVECFGAMGDE